MLLRIHVVKGTNKSTRALLLAAAFVLGMAYGVAAQTEFGTDVDPIKLFEQGQNAHARGEYEEALRLYDEALAARPEVPEINYQRGVALVSLKRRAEAEKAFRRAIELRDNWALPYSSLGLLLLADNRNDIPSSAQRTPTSREKEAAAFLSRALELDPKDFQSMIGLARLRAQTNSKPEALALLQRATTYPQATADLWMTRARIEREIKDTKAAASSTAEALKLDANNLDARMFRAELFLEVGDTQSLIAELRTIERLLSPATARNTTADNAAAYIASVYARLGEESRLKDAGASLDYYHHAVEIEPTNADYSTGYAAALVQARRFPEAVEILRRVIAAARDNYAAHANLAAALDELKRYPEALVEYRWLQEKRPEIAITDFFIARAHDLLGQYAEALTAYEAFLARADPARHSLEIEKINLRLPGLRRQARKAKDGK